MSSVLSGFRSAISDPLRSSRRSALLVIALLVVGTVGCDSESLVTSDAGHLDTALRLLGPDGVATGYVNVEAIESHADLWVESVTGQTPERDEMTDEFENRTGVDVENDVDAIFGTVHGGFDREDGSIIVFGTWDTDEVIDHLDDNMEINRIEHDGPDSFTAYGIAGLQAGQGTLFLAVAPAGYIMMTSSESRFESMMVRALSDDPVLSDEPFLDELSGYDAWMTANDLRGMLSDTAMPQGGEFSMIAPIFESIARAGLGVDLTSETATALMLVRPRESVRAEDLANVIRGGIAAARFQIMSDPDAPEMIQELLDRIDVDARANSVAVTMSIGRDEAAEFGQMIGNHGQ